MERIPTVYIMSNQRNGTLYVGVTSQLSKRVWEHRQGIVEGFTKRYKLHDLVYFEVCQDMYAAISREKQLKAGSRAKKINLIEAMNPCWNDLYNTL